MMLLRSQRIILKKGNIFKRVRNMKTLTKVDAVPLAIGIQKILLDMAKKGNDPKYPVEYFEQMIMDRKQVSRKAAELVTEKILGTGIIRFSIYENCFVL